VDLTHDVDVNELNFFRVQLSA